MLQIKAVQISEQGFTWSSGMNSPIYTDNRIINSYPNERKIIEKALADLIIAKFPNVECVIGVATGGITHAAYVSQILDLPMGYVRKTNKEHGRENVVEGQLKSNQKIVVIEDLFSTGASSLQAVNILKSHKYNVLGVVSIFSYELEKFKNNFKNITSYSLTNINVLLDVGCQKHYIKNTEATLVKEFLKKL